MTNKNNSYSILSEKLVIIVLKWRNINQIIINIEINCGYECMLKVI